MKDECNSTGVTSKRERVIYIGNTDGDHLYKTQTTDLEYIAFKLLEKISMAVAFKNSERLPDLIQEANALLGRAYRETGYTCG